MNRKNVLCQWDHLFISLVVILTGCQTTPRNPQLVNDLAAIHPDEFSRTNTAPIIDIHTHTFNGRDLPLEGIALGRRDAVPPWTCLVTDDAAKILAGILVADTRPETEADRLRHQGKGRVRRVTEMVQTLDIKPSSLQTLTNRPDALTNRSEFKATAKAHAFRKHDPLPPLFLGEGMALRSIDGFFGRKQSRFKPVGRELLERLSPFLRDLMLSDAELLNQFTNKNGPHVEFRISHMMDMAPTFTARWGARTRSWSPISRRSLPNKCSSYAI